MIQLRNVNIPDLNSATVMSGCDVLIKGKKIESINGGEYSFGECRVFDCTGKYLLPGLFDSHTHLSHLSTISSDEMAEELENYIHHGVFYVRDVGGPLDVISNFKRKIADGELSGPEIFYTGPMLESSPLTWGNINKDLPGFTVAVNNESDVEYLLPDLADQGADMVKTFKNISLPLFQHILMIAEKYSLRVVHDPGGPLFNPIPIHLAVKYGAKSIEHAKAPWPFVLRDDLRENMEAFTNGPYNRAQKTAFLLKVAEEGVNGLSETRLQKLARVMVAQDVFLCPTLHVFEKWRIRQDKAARMKKNKPETDQDLVQKKMLETMNDVSRHFVNKLAEYGVRLFVGQDGVVAQETIEEMKLMKSSGVSNIEILRGATIYPARWLGVDDRLGTIEPGKSADLLVLESNPLIDITSVEKKSAVIHQGKFIRLPIIN